MKEKRNLIWRGRQYTKTDGENANVFFHAKTPDTKLADITTRVYLFLRNKNPFRDYLEGQALRYSMHGWEVREHTKADI